MAALVAAIHVFPCSKNKSWMAGTSPAMTESCASNKQKPALEPLHPWPQLDLPRPGAARLMDEVKIGGRDCLGIKQAVGCVRWLGPACAPDAAIDNDMRHVDSRGGELARHALRQPAQSEFAHGERCRLGIAFHAGGRSREENRAML